MAVEAIKWQQTSGALPDATAPIVDNAFVSDRYDLATALRVVRCVETSASRSAVFAEITAKNPLFRLVDRLYAVAGSRLLQPLCLFLYMLKCIASLGPFDDGDAEAVSVANFGNEHHAVDRLAGLVPGVRLMNLSPKRSHMLGSKQLRAALRLMGAAPRIWRFLSRLARTHSFMPAARIASALAHYIGFSQLFAERSGLGAAIVASNYSPEGLGLSAAAHRMRRRVIYINHAPVPANGALVPPVLADCAVFYGDTIRQTYQRRSRCSAEVVLIGQPGTSRAMQWRDDVRTVGIFLTALTRELIVAELVNAISAKRPDVRIIIRNHPVALLKADYAQLAARHPNLSVTIGNPLDDEIAACDLIFCGNSGVAMNALSGGRPVAYMAALDALAFDYNGFVRSNLVRAVGGWSDDLYARLKTFYSAPAWQDVMRSYDASYGTDGAALERAAGQTIRRYLSQTPDPAPAGFHAELRRLQSSLASS